MRQGPDVTRLRIASLGVVFLSLVSALVLRLYFLQVLTHEDYKLAADQNRVRVVPTQPVRGRILDRNGEVLVQNRPSLVVSILPDELEDKETTLPELAGVLGMTLEQVNARLNDKTILPFAPVPVKEDVDEETITYLREHQGRFPGVIAEYRAVREYPKGQLAAHLLGYVGEINAEQLEEDRYKGRDYRPGSIVGKAGIEYAYEYDLHGKEGRRKFIVDSSGKKRAEEGAIESKPGLDVVTTIDARAQAVLEESLVLGLEKARTIVDKELLKKYPAPAGGAVVLDPRNGEVIAAASYPSYDPAAFVGGISKSEFQALSDNPAKPLVNRVIQAAFPPGSTFKVVTAAAALQEGVAQRNGRFACPGTVRLFNQNFRNWKASDSGVINIQQALIDSCNTVFDNFGAEFYRRYRRGEGERLQDYARAFGFDARSGIELPTEKPGRVPDEGWLKEVNRRSPQLFPYATWLPGYTINMSIGQGDVLTTPLQLANSYAAIANGGTLFRPHIGLRILDGEREVKKISPDQIRKLPISPQNLDSVRRGLEGVPTVGTARGAFAGFPLSTHSVAGKTGTAQLQARPPKHPYAWFAAYAPAKDPQYVVVVMLEEGGHGGETAAPIARRILEGLFGLPLSEITPAARTD
ncbi:MAG TPA: penicillin-binding protein 2 [Actinomycetota bacterium]|nr:penicillin-binding protein 2 [Actinomycetota bacterium]